MILANQDTIKPLIVGLPWIDPPLGYPLKINTGRNPMYPGSFPYIDRPIQPGATDQYDLSIRFGPPGTTKDTLATDLYRTFAAEHPPLVDWPDRRPFGDTFVRRWRAGRPAIRAAISAIHRSMYSRRRAWRTSASGSLIWRTESCR